MDVTSWYLQYLIQPVNTELMHVILTIFRAVRVGLSCSWKQLFAIGSTIRERGSVLYLGMATEILNLP